MSAEPGDGVTPYWIDTDPGVDDALALLLAVRAVGSRVVGCSTVQGNVDEPAAARNFSRVLATFDRHGLLPVGWRPVLARGSRLPLARGKALRATAMHGVGGLGELAWEPAAPWDHFGDEPAAVAICAAARTHPDLHLVCFGPLTNVALALHLDPELTTRLRRVTVMGGSLRAGGNETLAAEFNFAADPEAARAVLEADFEELRLVPIDGCQTARMTADDVARMEAVGSPAASVACEIVGQWRARIERGGQALYDALAWLLALRPELGTWKAAYVTVDTGRDVAHGASLADWRGRSGKTPNLRAAMAVDRRAVMDVLCGLLVDATDGGADGRDGAGAGSD